MIASVCLMSPMSLLVIGSSGCGVLYVEPWLPISQKWLGLILIGLGPWNIGTKILHAWSETKSGGCMNHPELVLRAERWLRNTIHCGVVLTELVAYTRSGEIPDAIGWVWGRPILVECKTSRSDFRADLKKLSRRDKFMGLGQWRFYFTPPGLITIDEIPEGWGLYEVVGRRVVYKGGEKYMNGYPKTPPFKSDRDSEVALLLSALRRKSE